MSEPQLHETPISDITRFVDIQAPPSIPTALFLFGTNQAQATEIASSYYHGGLAPLIIATGGVNRHDQTVEGEVFRARLLDLDVPDTAIRIESASANTWQNVEFSQKFLDEATAIGLQITAVSKWYHRRALHAMRTYLKAGAEFYAIGFDPLYGRSPITRQNWPQHPDGRPRVIREWEEIRRRVRDGEIPDISRRDDHWN